jgi:hypothetical protein
MASPKRAPHQLGLFGVPPLTEADKERISTAQASQAFRCKTCKAPIHFVTSTNGRRIPCDPGVVVVVPGSGPDVVVAQDGRVVRGTLDTSEARPEGAVVGYVSHFATCPDAKAHRRKAS